MKVGIATPVSLRMLAELVERGDEMPRGYEFPPHALMIREYVARGHDVSVYTCSRGITEPMTFVGPGLRIHIGRYRERGRARDFFAVERQDLVAAMAADPCDVVHAHWNYEFALAAIESGLPHLVTAHDAPLKIFGLYRDPYRFMRLLMSARAIGKTREMSAVSVHVADHLRKVFRYQRPISIVPNGLPSSVFEISATRHAPGAGITFATVLTGWSRLKNGRVALRAFQRTREAVPEGRLVMYGPGYGPGEGASVWAAAHGLDAGVEFAGTVPHPELMVALKSSVDVLVHPALEESFCMAIAEAMACGIAVIGGEKSGGVASTLDEGRAGRLVDVRSAGAVASAMVELAQDAALREKLATAAHASAQQRFLMGRVVERYEGIYTRILNQ